MRDVYVGQLEKLNQEMIEIGNFCERALREASESLVKGDTALAKQVLTYEAALDEREYVIEALCNRLLLLQQPVAGDLRIITLRCSPIWCVSVCKLWTFVKPCFAKKSIKNRLK